VVLITWIRKEEAIKETRPHGSYFRWHKFFLASLFSKASRGTMNAKRSMIAMEIMVRVAWLLFELFFHFVSFHFVSSTVAAFCCTLQQTRSKARAKLSWAMQDSKQHRMRNT